MQDEGDLIMKVIVNLFHHVFVLQLFLLPELPLGSPDKPNTQLFFLTLTSKENQNNVQISSIFIVFFVTR